MSKTRILAAAVILTGLGAALYFGWRGGPHPAKITEEGRCSKCNVVLISIDSLRADRMSLYGYKRKTTPFLDRWAESALVFNSFFATAYLTPISEASIHTGLYPERNGLTGFRNRIHPEVKTLAERLKSQGYATGAFGNSQEFLLYQSIRESFERGFDKYQKINRLAKMRDLPWNKIEAFVESNSNRPTFLWISVGNVHAPFGHQMENKFADPNYSGVFKDTTFMTNLQLYYEGILYPATVNNQFFMEPLAREYPGKKFSPMDTVPVDKPVKVGQEDLDYIGAEYDNGVYDMDQIMQKLVNVLAAHGLSGNTVFVFQSEHGEDLGEHGYIAHYDIWDTTVHVPLIIKSPAIKDGLKSDEFVSGVDVLPAVLDHLALAGADEPGLDGKNFLRHQAGVQPAVAPIRSEIFLSRLPFWESVLKQTIPDSIFDKFRAYDDVTQFKDYGVRNKTHKLIHRRGRLGEEVYSVWKYISGRSIGRDEFELYDRASEATGRRLSLERNEAVFRELKGKLMAWEEHIEKNRKKTKSDPKLQPYQ